MLPSTVGFYRCARLLAGLLALAHLPLGVLGAQDADKAITIPRVERPPRLENFLGAHGSNNTLVDGSASTDPALLGVRITDFQQREPGDGEPVSQATTAYLSYDNSHLYVVFVCTDDPRQVRANIARREDIGDDDQVVIYLDTFHDRERAYLFAVNPLGIQQDGIRTEGQDEDMSFDAVWSSEGRLTPDGYVVRMAIPFRSLRFPRATEQTWGVALGRVIRRKSEESYWPLVTKRIKGFVPQFAELQGLKAVSPGRNIQLNPYTTLARARVLNDEVAAFETPEEQRTGIDAKVVLRDALTVDATVNPDFSQVETDDPQVTVNERFEVFYPEKRPFFIENAGYFQTPVNLVFSRRVVDPGAGLRLSGKIGGWAVGAFAINDREPGRVEDADDPLAGKEANVGVFRLQREIGDESTVGVLVTGRELAGSFNRVLSLDSRLKLSDNWFASYQIIHSLGRDLEDARFSDFGGLGKLEYDGRHLEYSGEYVQFGPSFMIDDSFLGFVRRVGIRQTEHEAQYKFRPDDSFILAFGPTASALYVWDPNGMLLDRELSGSLQIELEGETEVEVEHNRLFEFFENFSFRPYSTEASFSTAWFKWLVLDASYEWGTAVNHDPADGLDPFLGRVTEAQVSVTLRPTPWLRLDQTYLDARMKTDAKEPVFRERLVRSKINYQFSRFLSLRAILDWEEEDANAALFDEDEREREFAVDLLLTYLLRPGTAVYVGYTDKYENVSLTGDPPEIGFQRWPRLSTGRQVFVKLSYLWRF